VSALPDRRLARLFSCAGHPILVLDPVRDRIRYANNCACRVLGYAADELLAVPASAIFPAESRGLKSFLDSIEQQGGWLSGPVLRPKKGDLLQAELLALPFGSDEQRYVLVLANCHTR
jgi:PAS domain-containing protein